MNVILKQDTFWVRTNNGILLKNGKNSIHLTGKNVFELFDRIAPFLKGQYSKEQILGALQGNQAEIVASILDNLNQREFLIFEESKLPHNLSLEELEAFNSQISYIGINKASPEFYFQQFRTTKLLIIGAAQPLTSMVSIAIENGIREVSYIDLNNEKSTSFQINEYLDSINGIHTGVYKQPNKITINNEQDIIQMINKFDSVLYIAPSFTDPLAFTLSKACEMSETILGISTILPSKVYVGPFYIPDNSLCWNCLRLILQSNDEVWLESDILNRTIPPAVASITATLSIYKLFKIITNIQDMADKSNIYVIGQETLETYETPMYHVKHCPINKEIKTFDIKDVLQRMEKDNNGFEELGNEEFIENCTEQFVSEELGMIQSIDEENFIQVPVNQCVARIRVPGEHQLIEVYGTANDPISARKDVLQQALNQYAEHLTVNNMPHYAVMETANHVWTWTPELNVVEESIQIIENHLSPIHYQELSEIGTVVSGANLNVILSEALLINSLKYIIKHENQYTWQEIQVDSKLEDSLYSSIQDNFNDIRIKRLNYMNLTVLFVKADDYQPIVVCDSNQNDAINLALTTLQNRVSTSYSNTIPYMVGNNVQMSQEIFNLFEFLKLKICFIPLIMDELSNASNLRFYYSYLI
ncbi:hypothetical protein [Ornithinibacillus halotolerans]|uniref:Thiazole-containing bacteriocin maturation protein n=1 Tax=Ornithinibacillus halotolerans TaxID=1274357 RepID=A0A916RR50_9BACI|nr:hypothetical protein [Ornithinibacillus halotolerans]GGA66173.1 hypothetical protein GCM10008025_07500 [Ornithinibacillus halotolerans]